MAWSILVLAFALLPIWTAGSTWFGPLGLGTHPMVVHIQFMILGLWLALGAPKTVEALKIR